jgi:putative DNA primase/helicase
VIDRLVAKPLLAMNISPSVLFRVVEMYKPTLLIDEADSFAKDNDDLRGILNSGHARNGSVMRSVGDDHAPRAFSTWSPLCLAGIGSLPGTVEDRSISIRLRRKLPSEKVDRIRMNKTEHLHVISRKCARWAQDAFDSLKGHDPKDFVLTNDRATDNWEALISIAEIAGGNWPAIARNTAQAMTTEESDQESIAVRVLADIREVLESDGPEAAIWTETLLDKLKLDPEKPWATHGRSPGGLNAQQLARFLRLFGINSGTVRVANQVTKAGTSTAKGYRKNNFDDAFARYLGIPAVTTTQPAENCAKPAIPSRHKTEVVTAGKSVKPLENIGCDVVTARNPLFDELEESVPENRKWEAEI